MYEQLISAAQIVEKNKHLFGNSITQTMQSMTQNINIPALSYEIVEKISLSDIYSQGLSEAISGIRQMSSITAVYQQITKEMRDGIASFAIGVYSQIGTSLLKSINEELKCFTQDLIQSQMEFVRSNQGIFEDVIFIKIANEISFPVYLEIGSELKPRLLESYRVNNNQCNVEEMQQIILDYYNDDYVEAILHSIENVNIFRNDRVCLIREGVEVYQEGHYGASGALFATQMSGMILDIHNELEKNYVYPDSEKRELLNAFHVGSNCKLNSEKAMLLQIIDRQENGILVWTRIAQYFVGVTYSSNDCNMSDHPMRHKICHGIQTNYNTKEMNLKQIICLDILAELAWRIKQMNADEEAIVVEG